KAANQRRDYLHKLTTHLVKQYDVIAIEDLKTKNLQKNQKQLISAEIICIN
ncbi:transposase, partial [Gracilibacillus sp. S3-1-1]